MTRNTTRNAISSVSKPTVILPVKNKITTGVRYKDVTDTY